MIRGATRETQLYLTTLASVLASSVDAPEPLLDLSDVEEPSPAAQRVAVAEVLDEVLGDLDRILRTKKMPPARSNATLGRLLVTRGESYDAVKRTYTPGPGFDTLISALANDAVTDAVVAAIDDGTLDPNTLEAR
ncbi:Uncharacterised protein (plasmid) [Tsukamurella tyrosinosolvens]|uniref:Uncharacterized protein n=1 Tax=Tsukamurella tyrosinosolvens TaxID=57704 RepID=A0A1H4VH28_TSUTY|nr:hypothetical protein [Tsukamurella tyrosinosolvens]KXO91107.1 hypothetical protein AXK58_21320 [Tsukamurella tyrosinosolvens]SEC80422.1 hypothetical protein SAMN04489793_3230 [Tsukamurella tyrosinosolvens]VEH90514.1 Uncharacterised protein [Tsukamurella tyrosinosolvens]